MIDRAGQYEHHVTQDDQGKSPNLQGAQGTPDPLDEIIREVALRHGISVGRDDPILMTYTINRRIMETTAAIQRQVLEQHLKDMEALSTKMQEQVKGGMEKALREASGNMQVALREEMLRCFSQQEIRTEAASREMREEFLRCRQMAASGALLSVLAVMTATMLLWSFFF